MLSTAPSLIIGPYTSCTLANLSGSSSEIRVSNWIRRRTMICLICLRNFDCCNVSRDTLRGRSSAAKQGFSGRLVSVAKCLSRGIVLLTVNDDFYEARPLRERLLSTKVIGDENTFDKKSNVLSGRRSELGPEARIP